MEAYHPATNSWTAKASMPGGGRNSMGLAVIDNRLYVVGGITTGEALTTMGEMYNPITDTWSPIASMPTVRYAMAIGVIDGILYAAGGGNNIPDFAAVDAYDPTTNSWSPRAPLSAQRTYVASAVVNGLLYAIGGQNSINLSSVEIYDPATDSWSAGPALPAARSIMPAVNVAGRIYVTGGGYTNTGGLFGDTLMLADTFAPATTATLSPPANGNGWNNSDPAVTLTATGGAGGSGVASITYSLAGAQSGGATIIGNSTAFAITSEGTTTVTYHAVDAAGNVEADRQLVVKVDHTAPTLPGLPDVTVNAMSSAGAVVAFNVVGSDALSGVVSTQFSPKSSGMTFPAGVTHETVTVTDAAGNVAIGGFEVTVNPQKALVSVEVSPASASVTPGQNQQFQAIGHFSDGTTTVLLGGNGGGGGGIPTGPSNPAWSVQMSPPINVNACATPQSPGPLVFSSQGFFDHGGAIHTTWSPGTPVVNVDGAINPSNVTLTLACTTNSATGSIVAAWTGTRYQGTYSFNGGASAGSVSITGWSPQAPMRATRFSHAAASVNGNVYVFGGNPGQPSPVLKYATGTNSWITLGNMPTSREGLSAATINGLVYVVGGHVSGGIASGVLEAYDAATDSWASLAPMPTPRADLAAVTDGTYLYALGGDTFGSNSGLVSTVERYDPVANSWSALASMPTAGNFVVAGMLNNTIVVAGAGNSSNTDVYEIATNTWHSGAPASPTAGCTSSAAR